MSYSDIQIARIAKEVREEIGLDQLSPILNMKEVVEEIGHHVAEESFGDEFSATCLPIDPPKFGIILNRDSMWNENFVRFTLAHELGHAHLVEHWAEMQRQGGQLKTKAEFQSDQLIEREADRFAINFLAPVGLVRSYIDNMEFTKSSLSDLSNLLGISLLSSAFRFVELTDLCCSLIIVDVSTQKIKYEFRSRLMKQYNRHPFLKGWYVPEQGSVTRVLRMPKGFDIEDQVIELNEYYQNRMTSIRCLESVFRLGYNNTVMVLLSALEDPEDLL